MIILIMFSADAAGSSACPLGRGADGQLGSSLGEGTSQGLRRRPVFLETRAMSLLHGLNVLVVGEHGGVADSIASPLRADGHFVGDAPDGAAAVAAARVHLPDVVLLDADL